MLGDAIRQLDDAPSKEWIKGFDAGYCAAIKVIQDLSNVQEQAMKNSADARHRLADVQKTLAHVEDTIGRFRCPIMQKSILSQDLGS